MSLHQHVIFMFIIFPPPLCSFFFFFNDTATTEIYTLSLHDALPISNLAERVAGALDVALGAPEREALSMTPTREDRKSTRLNSSHGYISYAVFCLKKKKKKRTWRKTQARIRIE